MCNLAHHYKDFHIEASWTFSASGHGKGPCDGIGAVVKSTATNYLLRGEPNASFSSPKQFYEWCFQKNDRMVVRRLRRMEASSYASSHMPEPNRPIEVRWLSADIINQQVNNNLMLRWNQLSARGMILFDQDFVKILIFFRFDFRHS